MKKDNHIKEAKLIGADSWTLLNFDQLPKNASAKRQIAALKRDHEWLQNHTDEVLRRIDYLVHEIESED